MIKVEHLSKVYGNRVAVWDLSFDLKKGEILGFLGPNGAGKTTTMRMITGFIPPSSGTATVAGYDIAEEPLKVKGEIGYLCEAPPVYREMSVKSYLKFVARLKKVPRSRMNHCLDRALQLCGLEDVAGRVIGNLSKGYRQRVGLAQAIIHKPAVLILDEPTVGLDPRQIRDIRSLITELSGEQTVILSTHILPEVTVTCSRVIIISEGQVVAEDTVEGLTEGLSKSETMTLRVERTPEGFQGALAALDQVVDVAVESPNRFQVRLEGGDATRALLANTVVRSGAGLLEMARSTATLEEVFLKLVTEEPEGEVA
ncbi:MAG: ABC transporter ATP-binding protein [Acidobacteria bacterium]|uniref:ABC transporter ATP-binding protein n=1 Tax=Candidatus Polarisedimenticola svalbardensis TaxID=2886004 RepID=A0A8J6Y6M0_9BACT|nr:ABC transporter ATP-binding protein [Candidatus Polarisedimenticola svalbardensis]